MNNNGEQTLPHEVQEPSARIERELQRGEAALRKLLGEPTLITIARGVGHFFREHPAILMTVVYVQITGVGVVYSSSLFRQFAVDIMVLAEASDFLVAAFRDPLSVILALVLVLADALIVSYAILCIERPLDIIDDQVGLVERLLELLPDEAPGESQAASQAARELMPKLKENVDQAKRRLERSVKRTLIGSTALLVVCTFLLPYLGGWAYARRVRTGDGRKVVVQLRSSADPETASTLEGDIYLVGTTGKFAFFYDRDQKYTRIIPTANILHMQIVPSESTELRATPTSTPIDVER